MLRPGGDAIFTSTTDVVRFCDITILEPIERSSIAFLRTVGSGDKKRVEDDSSTRSVAISSSHDITVN